MAFIPTHLGQSRPSGTTAASILAGAANKIELIQQIIIANNTASAANASVYLDNDGTTYDQTTCLLYSVSIPANSTLVMSFGSDWQSGLYLTGTGNLAVQTGTGSALTFTINGGIYQL